jgi:hypothetical protein
MNREQAIRKAVICRHGERTFIPSTGEDKFHHSFNTAKKYVRNFLGGLGPIHDTHKICVTGKGIIQQVQQVLEQLRKKEEASKVSNKAETVETLKASRPSHIYGS